MIKQIFLSLLVSAVLGSCRFSGGVPKTDHLGAEPEAHNGVFVNGSDTLFFNGDGKSIRWSLSKNIDSLQVSGEGSYVFKLYNGKFRYDAAEEMSIHDGQKAHTFMTGPGQNSEDQITILVTGDDKKPQAKVFKKVK